MYIRSCDPPSLRPGLSYEIAAVSATCPLRAHVETGSQLWRLEQDLCGLVLYQVLPLLPRSVVISCVSQHHAGGSEDEEPTSEQLTDIVAQVSSILASSSSKVVPAARLSICLHPYQLLALRLLNHCHQ